MSVRFLEMSSWISLSTSSTCFTISYSLRVCVVSLYATLIFEEGTMYGSLSSIEITVMLLDSLASTMLTLSSSLFNLMFLAHLTGCPNVTPEI